MSFGDTWSTANNSLNSSNWTGVAMTPDGMKIIAVNSNGYAQISTDGGVGWVNAGGSAIARSATACTQDFGIILNTTSTSIERSTDSGVTFSNVGPLLASYNGICCTPSGSYAYATKGATPFLYKSTDGGATWSPVTTSSTSGHLGLICSDDGKYILCRTNSTTPNYVIRSSDFGVTWTGVSTVTAACYGVALSSDGQHQYAAYSANNLGTIAISHDYGATWSSLAVGSSATSVVACSDDGRYIVFGSAYSSLFASTDYGVHWYQAVTGQTAAIDSIAMSSTGQRIVGGSHSGTRVATCLSTLLSINSISPVSGSVSGGTAVTISGTGFESGAIATVGGLALTGQAIVNQFTITGTTQAHASGSVDVVVTNP